ncbi:MAG TPA: M1 family aminopeptidase [Gemmatales bacterium]|nr:M1 family aminopeptidase [Gemmatales bacterium]
MDRLGELNKTLMTTAARLWLAMLCMLFLADSVQATDVPSWLPQYDLDLKLDLRTRRLWGVEKVTFYNRHDRPATELVFNAYSRYKIPDGDGVKLAKTLELLRSNPSDGIDWVGERLNVQAVFTNDERGVRRSIPFAWRKDLHTAFEVALATPLKKGESITVEVHFTLDLPDKEGRWGHREGITYLTHALPALAYYDEKGWQPTPFIAWHQPFFQEAGIYNVRMTLPEDQKLACTGTILSESPLGDGTKMVSIASCCAREFSFVCSNRFQEWSEMVERTRVRVLALPEHKEMAQRCLKVACEAIPLYNRWFGPYPFGDFCIAESHFAWNGNECSGLVMIDSRVMSISPLLERYIDHLISHETLHQWWYNIVGTNGYRETFMDEAVACYYTAKVMQKKFGRNSKLLQYPVGQSWLPNVKHEDYRFYGLYGTLARKEETVTIQEMEKFGNVITLFSMTYDRGAKIFNMIEERIGEEALFDFMRLLYAKYQFRILFVADFQRELETYTGRSWKEFFDNWFYGVGGSDWSLSNVAMEKGEGNKGSFRAKINVRQLAEFTEPTYLGFKFKGDESYTLRIPVRPGETLPGMNLAGMPATQATGTAFASWNLPSQLETEAMAKANGIVPLQYSTDPDGKGMTIVVDLPSEPVQISIDPDQVQLDKNPANNHWKLEPEIKLTPLLTPLDETDITTSYDRWNIMAGPWLGLSRPQFGQQAYAGVRADLFRLQTFQGGGYVAWNAYNQDMVAGADMVFQHFPDTHMEVGAQYDHSLTSDWASLLRDRARVYGRYIINETSSLYLNPIEYVETYARLTAVADGSGNGRFVPPGVEGFNNMAGVGLFWTQNYLTPYWDPEGGYRLNFNFEYGLPIFGTYTWYDLVQGEAVLVKSMPEGLGYLSDTKWAFRAWGGKGFPANGYFFQLGGANMVRGLSRDALEGDMGWIGSIEWRLPIWKNSDVDFCYRVGVMKNLYLALFYDVGEIYLNNNSNGGVVHSFGAGLRFDLGWLGFIERTTVRLDVAKAVNQNDSVQFWFGLQHAF